MTDTSRAEHGRFAKGQTGNPNGRPRKDRSVNSAILKAATATVTANENGKRRKMRKLDATAAQISGSTVFRKGNWMMHSMRCTVATLSLGLLTAAPPQT